MEEIESAEQPVQLVKVKAARGMTAERYASLSHACPECGTPHLRKKKQ